MPIYAATLAHIHDSDYGTLARSGARLAVRELLGAESSTTAAAASQQSAPGDGATAHGRGPIVDLGCGSGCGAEVFAAHGYDVVGVDSSPNMLKIARQRVPTADLQLASIYDVEIPRCDAVVALGEIFNYVSPGRSSDALAALLTQVRAALSPGGFLLCDLAGPGRTAATPSHQHVEGDGWRMDVATAEDADSATMTRTITVTQADIPATEITPETEIHTLALLSPDEFHSLLSQAGLLPERIYGYGDFMFPHDGWHAWIARAA